MSVKHIDSRASRMMQDSIHNRYTIELSPDITYDDLFKPIAWAHHAAKFRRLDIVRCIAADWSFDVDLTVYSVVKGGVVMRERLSGKRDGKPMLAKVPFARDGHPVARVEYRPATQWRAVGLNGEISSGHPSEHEAKAVLEKYIKDAGLVMPSEDEIAKSVAEATERAEAAKEAAKAARGKKAA